MRYLPLVFPYQYILISLCLLVFLVTVFNKTSGALVIVFCLPVINSLPLFFSLKALNPLIFLFYSFFIGVLIHQSFSRHSLNTKSPLRLPIIGAAALVGISALLTFWRYTNFFPIYDNNVYDLTVNVIDVKAGGALERILFDTLNYAAGFIWFFIVMNIFRKKEVIKKALILLSSSAFLSFCFGLYQSYFNLDLGNTWFFISIKRANALFSDPNALGVFIAFSIPIFMGGFLSFKKRERLIFVSPILAGILLIPGSGSRSAFLGIVIAALCMTVFYLKKMRVFRKSNPRQFRKAVIFSLSIVFLLSLFFVVLLTGNSTLSNRFKSNIASFAEENFLQKITKGRTTIWKAGFMMWAENPVSGIGLGSFTVELPNYYKEYNIKELKYRRKDGTPEVLVDTADNFYIHILSELGIIGLIFFLWIFYRILRQIFRQASRMNLESGFRGVLTGISAGLISLFILFLFGIHTMHFEIQLVFWLALGILFSLTSEEEDKRNESSLKKHLVIFLVILFTAFHVWGTFHDLSLKKRIEKFNLSSNFGFYQQEVMQQRIFRWTKKTAGLTVHVDKPVMSVSVLASHPDIQEKPVTLELYFIKELFREKRFLDRVIIRKSSWINLKYDFSNEVGSEGILLFKVSRTWQPKKVLGTQDPRLLGVAVSELNFDDKKSE
jgi:O-antigen ligase